MMALAGKRLCMGCGESLGGGLAGLVAALTAGVAGHPGVVCGEPLSRHTTWRVGGPAERFFRPAGVSDLAAYLRGLPASEPLFWLGGGSNLLVRDGGLRGSVICLRGALDHIESRGDGALYVEAGASCARVARMAAREGLGGVEFLAGIPGTLGGALAMNAGAFGGEIWPLVEQVETIDRRGVLRRRAAGDYQWGYREVTGPSGEWFVAATLRLPPHDAETAIDVRTLLERRNRTQPMELPSAGSVFRNPPGDHAGRLIEASGLKGCCIGAACVSERHANFIVNTGGATAAEIEALIERVEAVVAEQHGIRLVREVRIVGEGS